MRSAASNPAVFTCEPKSTVKENKKPRWSRRRGVLSYFSTKKNNTNEVKIVWHKGCFHYEYQAEEGKTGMTTLAGLPTYMDLASATGLLRSLDRHLKIRGGSQGRTDRQMVFSLMMLNLAGGDCVEDIEKLEADEGLCRVIRLAEASGLARKEKLGLASRWRKERTRTLPSASAIFRYLSFFHDKEQEKQRAGGKAFIPAGYEQLRVLKESLHYLPERVKKVRLRSDTAGYQHDLLRHCGEGKNERFGRIEFAIGSDVTREFRKAVLEVPESDWHPLYRTVKGEKQETGRQWAEVCFVPAAIGHSKKGPAYRYLATREALRQAELPGMNKKDEEYPFPVMGMQGIRYKTFGIVTNMDWTGDELIPWLYARCGKSEEAHAAMKNDFAGGRFPSGDFGENAAWWWITVLAYNLNALMKSLVLGDSWINKRMKAVRFGIINIAGRVIEHSRRLLIKISGYHPSCGLLLEARRRIAVLASSA